MRSDWLEAFVVFCEHMNLTRAAQALHLSQPALHAQLQRLAQEVGAPLYLRQGRGLALTAQGREVARFAREQRQRQRAFLQELRMGRSHEPVVLATGQGAALYLLGPALARFVALELAPLRLHTDHHQACLEAVVSGRAHLGVTVWSQRLEGWPCDELGAWRPSLAVPVGHPLQGEGALGLSALEGLEMVVPPPGQPWRERLAQALEAQGVSWSVAAEASGWPLILHLVQLGLGAAVVNGCCQAPQGVALRPLEGLEKARYVLLCRDREALPPAAQALRRELLAAVSADPR